MQVATPKTWETLNFTSLILDNKSKKEKIQTSDYLETGETYSKVQDHLYQLQPEQSQQSPKPAEPEESPTVVVSMSMAVEE